MLSIIVVIGGIGPGDQHVECIVHICSRLPIACQLTEKQMWKSSATGLLLEVTLDHLDDLYIIEVSGNQVLHLRKAAQKSRIAACLIALSSLIEISFL